MTAAEKMRRHRERAGLGRACLTIETDLADIAPDRSEAACGGRRPCTAPKQKKASTEADADKTFYGPAVRAEPRHWVYLKTVVTLTFSARTGGRNDRIGNVLVRPGQEVVKEGNVSSAKHVHMCGSLELA